MGLICRLIFVILFIPIMFIAIGDRHEPYKVLDWLSDNLADYGKEKEK